ncbi:hypothetical protein Ahy_A02g009490 [Arachis hypogaea]|uniref:GRF-type domain-containing protein n=1 Tax=Arachis hypogaea TaxID=3818 RepID=A0A445EH50_ARAHY|nr:hypothetical protein Ahy_A02g009490 [Arachis hypogaea]
MVVLIRLIVSDECSSNTRGSRGGDGERHERTVGNAIPYSVQVGNEKDGVALKCFCGVCVIFYMSKTNTNSNRLFFGCPFFKVKQPHYKFFVWVNDHIGRIGRIELTRKLGDNQSFDVEEYFIKKEPENIVVDLKQRIIYLKNKKKQ